MTTTSSELSAPASKGWSVLWTVLMPGLGHYHAGVGLAGALGIGVMVSVIFLVLTAGVARWLPTAGFIASMVGAALVTLFFLIRSVLQAVERSQQGRPRRTKWNYVTFIVATMVIGVLFDVIKTMPGVQATKNFHLPTAAMEPTLVVGDRVTARLSTFDSAAGLRRGDIIVFRYPPDPKILYVKRLVAFAGETFRMEDDVLVINGARQERIVREKTADIVGDITEDAGIKTLFEETFDGRSHFVLQNIPSARRFARANFPADGSEYVIPDGAVFVMGDNRDNSTDSRVWGVVPYDHIVGVADTILYSAHDGGFRMNRLFKDLP